MVDPEKIIEFPRGKFITSRTAAEVLKVGPRRVLQLINDEGLTTYQFGEKGERYIALKDFERLASKPRPTGRPKTKLEVKKKVEKKGKR